MKKKEKNNNAKIVFEIILIPLCFLYLFYTLFINHPKVSFVICLCITIITSIEFAIKYLKEVYIYENKYNPLKVIFGIFNILLIIIAGLNIIYNIKVILILFYVMISILLLYLLYFFIRNLIDVVKGKGVLYKKAFASLLIFTSFVTILITLIIAIM